VSSAMDLYWDKLFMTWCTIIITGNEAGINCVDEIEIGIIGDWYCNPRKHASASCLTLGAGNV
jgi:hypothetical protein